MLQKIAIIIISIMLLSLSVSAGDKGSLNDDLFKQFEENFNKNNNNNFIINAVTNNNIKSLSLDRSKVVGHDAFYNVELKSTDIINQKSSGRCWIFAGVNSFSPKVMTKLNLSDFEISESYLAFYDKMEKANFFLERIIELRDKPIDDRSLLLEMQYLFGDGGWWHYFAGLIEKYGIVPIEAMPETKQTSSTGMYNKLGKTLLRGYAAELRRMNEDGKSVKQLRQRKEEMMADIYQLLVYNFGLPPKEFTWRFEYEDKDDTTKTDKEVISKTYTPKSFYNEYFGESKQEFVALTNIPTKDFGKLYEMQTSRNIYEADDFQVVNFPIEKLKEYTLKSLLDSQIVWFACDVGKENYSDSGIFKVGVYDYNSTFNLDFGMSKADRISYGDISPNHAMVIKAADTTNEGTPVKWKVENSWGSKRGDSGFWHMYDNWFDEYVLLIIVDKKLLSDEDKALFDTKPELIKDWEPFFKELTRLK